MKVKGLPQSHTFQFKMPQRSKINLDNKASVDVITNDQPASTKAMGSIYIYLDLGAHIPI
jgi:hypothetical protein